MTETPNPYESPPDSKPSQLAARQSYAKLCTVMFWIATLLALAVLAMGVLMIFQNYVTLSAMNSTTGTINMPPYIKALNVHVICNAGVFAFSAFSWRRRRIKVGLVMLILGVVGFFVVPWILLSLLM